MSFYLCKLLSKTVSILSLTRSHSCQNQIISPFQESLPLSLYCPPATAPFFPFLDNLIPEKKCFYSYFIISSFTPQTAAIWLSLLLKLLLPSSPVDYLLPKWWTHLILLFHITLSSLKLFFSLFCGYSFLVGSLLLFCLLLLNVLYKPLFLHYYLNVSMSQSSILGSLFIILYKLFLNLTTSNMLMTLKLLFLA